MVLLRRMGGLTLIALAFLGLLGCGSGSKVVRVSGTLTYQGKPVPNAILHVVPAQGRPSIAQTDAQGRFELTYDPETKGAERGKHKVWVEANPTAGAREPGMPAVIPPEWKEFFAKYSGENSKQEVTIDGPVSDLKLAWD